MDRTLYFACNSFDNEADMMIRFAPDDAAKCALRDFPWSELTVVRNFIVATRFCFAERVGDFGGIFQLGGGKACLTDNLRFKIRLSRWVAKWPTNKNPARERRRGAGSSIDPASTLSALEEVLDAAGFSRDAAERTSVVAGERKRKQT